MLRGVLLQTFKCGMEAEYVLCLLLLLLFIFARAAKEGLSVTLMERLVKLYPTHHYGCICVVVHMWG